MLTTLLSLAFGFQETGIEEQPRAPLIVVGRDEAQTDLAPIFDTPVSEEIIAERTGLKVHEVVFEGRSVYISELVAPIDCYEGTIRFLKSLRSSNGQGIAYGSELGKQLSGLFRVVAPREAFDAKPTDECYSVYAAIGFTDPTGQMVPQNGYQLVPTQTKDAPRRTKLAKRPDMQAYLMKNLASSPIFPRILTQYSYSVVPLTSRRIDASTSADNVRLSGEALAIIGQEVKKLQLMSSDLYDEILVKFANEQASGVPLDGKPTKLSELPPKVSAQLRRSIEGYYEQISEDELARIQAFLDSDPAFTFEVHLGAFESYSNVNPDGTTAVRSGAGFIFGNPGGEKPRKNPPPN